MPRPLEDRIADAVSELTTQEVMLLMAAAKEDDRNGDEDYSQFKDALEDALIAGL